MTLRDRVRELAHERGLTLRDLAAVAFPDAPVRKGAARPRAAAERRLDRLLAGGRGRLGRGASYAHLQAVADCLGVSVDEMLEGVVG